MIKSPIPKSRLMFAVASVVIVLVIVVWQKAGKQTQDSVQAVDSVFAHTHVAKVTDIRKHQFEHKFAAQCVERELINSTDRIADEAHWQKTCLCIAGYLMKDLTVTEAEKFLEKNQSPQSLAIKYQGAVYHCLQARKSPQGPNLFARPQ